MMLFQFYFIDGSGFSGIEGSNYIGSNNLGQNSCPVPVIEKIRYSECFITLKIEGKKSGPTKSSGSMVIPVLRGSSLEGVYDIILILILLFLQVNISKIYRYHWYTSNVKSEKNCNPMYKPRNSMSRKVA